MTNLEQSSTSAPQRLQETLARYQELGVRQVKLGLTDIDGVIRGKYVGLKKFAGLMQKQGGFCDCVSVGTLTISYTMLALTPAGTAAFLIQVIGCS